MTSIETLQSMTSTTVTGYGIEKFDTKRHEGYPRNCILELFHYGADDIFADVESTTIFAELHNIAGQMRGKGAELAVWTKKAQLDPTVNFYEMVEERMGLEDLDKLMIQIIGGDYINHPAPRFDIFKRTMEGLEKEVCLVSGGLEEAMQEVELIFGKTRIDANKTIFDDRGNAKGIVLERPVAHTNGKTEHIAKLQDTGEMRGCRSVMIGDGKPDAVKHPIVKAFLHFYGYNDEPEVAELAPAGFDNYGVPLVLLAGRHNWEKIIYGRDAEARALFIEGLLSIVLADGFRIKNIDDYQEMRSELWKFAEDHHLLKMSELV